MRTIGEPVDPEPAPRQGAIAHVQALAPRVDVWPDDADESWVSLAGAPFAPAMADGLRVVDQQVRPPIDEGGHPPRLPVPCYGSEHVHLCLSLRMCRRPHGARLSRNGDKHKGRHHEREPAVHLPLYRLPAPRALAGQFRSRRRLIDRAGADRERHEPSRPLPSSRVTELRRAPSQSPETASPRSDSGRSPRRNSS